MAERPYDFVTVDQFSNAISVRLNDGAGGGAGSGGIQPVLVALGDVDNDGDLDAAAANGSGAIGVRLNDGAGSLGGGPDLPVGSFPTQVAIGDLDGPARLTPEGLPDLGPLVPVLGEFDPLLV